MLVRKSPLYVISQQNPYNSQRLRRKGVDHSRRVPAGKNLYADGSQKSRKSKVNCVAGKRPLDLDRVSAIISVLPANPRERFLGMDFQPRILQRTTLARRHGRRQRDYKQEIS